MPQTPATLMNLKRGERCDEYIGRPSRWGNPYIVGKDGTREQVVERYEKWIRGQKGLMNTIGFLRGKSLGCFCTPLPCHGDVLIKILKELYPEDYQNEPAN
jgi:uncharacterized protein DUF4326